MEKVIEKLDQAEDTKQIWNHWSLQEIKQLLDIYYIISKKEEYIFELIYNYHGCDSWEDIFRDYNPQYLDDKANGVAVAINEINEIITRIEKKENQS